MATDDANHSLKNPSNSSDQDNTRRSLPSFLVSSVGGRKFALAALAMVALLIGAAFDMDDATRWYIMILALGGAGAIAIEDVLKKK